MKDVVAVAAELAAVVALSRLVLFRFFLSRRVPFPFSLPSRFVLSPLVLRAPVRVRGRLVRVPIVCPFRWPAAVESTPRATCSGWSPGVDSRPTKSKQQQQQHTKRTNAYINVHAYAYWTLKPTRKCTTQHKQNPT